MIKSQGLQKRRQFLLVRAIGKQDCDQEEETMSGSVSDLNSGANRRMQSGPAPGKDAVHEGSLEGAPGSAGMSSREMAERNIIEILYPGGLIPYEERRKLPEIERTINHLLQVVEGHLGKRRELTPEENEAVNVEIIRLKNGGATELTIAKKVGLTVAGVHNRILRHRRRMQKKNSSRVPAGREDPAPGSQAPHDAKAGVQERVVQHQKEEKDGCYTTNSRATAHRSAAEPIHRAETPQNVPEMLSEVPQKMKTAPGQLELHEAGPAQSHSAQDLEPTVSKIAEQVVPAAAAAARAPKIPHSEDEFILTERAGGKKFRLIHGALRARGIKCKLDDVIARHHSLLKKAQEEPRAGSRSPELQQLQAEPDPASTSRPVGLDVSPEDLQWILDLAEKDWSAEEISMELTQNGVSLDPDEIALIHSQRQEGKDPQPTEISHARRKAHGAGI